MATAQATPAQATVLSGRSRLAYLGYAGLAAIVGWWSWRAFHDPLSWDTGLAYSAGQLAWKTGHPEHLLSWMGTPLLGAAMALLSRAVSVRTAADLVTALNIALWCGGVGVVLHRTRRLLSPVWWWVAAFGLLSFGPLLSSVWSKQFNVIVLVLAVAGFDLVRRRRVGAGAAAIGLSVAIKPMAILLPLVMLARRETRRAGALAIAWIAGLSVASQGLIAARAHNLGALDPTIALRNFLDKKPPLWAPFLCHPINVAPGSLLCRSIGSAQHWTLQRVVVLGAVALLSLWVIDSLRGRAASSWEVLAFSCAISAMVTPFEWNHYQIMLAPLFFLLLFRFVREGAPVSAWSGLAVAFVLASLLWVPYGTIAGGARHLLSGVTESHAQLTFLAGISQFAQYVLIVTGVFWYIGRRRIVIQQADSGSNGADRTSPDGPRPVVAGDEPTELAR